MRLSAITGNFIAEIEDAFACEAGAQRRQTAVKYHPDISFRQIEGLCDLAMTKPGKMVQQNGLALPVG